LAEPPGFDDHRHGFPLSSDTALRQAGVSNVIQPIGPSIPGSRS
jgi:hypothetical protein